MLQVHQLRLCFGLTFFLFGRKLKGHWDPVEWMMESLLYLKRTMRRGLAHPGGPRVHTGARSIAICNEKLELCESERHLRVSCVLQ